MAVNYGSTSGVCEVLKFHSQSNEYHNVQVKLNTMAIINFLSWPLRSIVSPLASIILDYILKIDDNYTVDVADKELHDSDAYATLKSLGAQIEQLQNSNLTNYFDTDYRTFQRTISGTGDLNSYVNDIVEFCASYKDGHINTTAIKNILTSLLKTEMSEEHSTINKTTTEVIYTTKQDKCGVIRLTFTGDQIKITNCCSSSTNIKIKVDKVVIMFRNTKDLLATLRTFVQAN